jgi:sporulation protein YlmC with PRC-barrel domain
MTMASEMHALRSTEIFPNESDPIPAVPVQVVAPLERLFGATDLEPAVTPDAPQRDIRYERGSTVYALDGPVGTLKQIVIDEDAAEVKALVVRMTAKNELILMPPDLVDKSVGTALVLNVTKEQFALGASRSPRFEARLFSGADTKAVAKIMPLAFRGNKQRSVVSIASDVVQTSEVLAPLIPEQPAPDRRPWWKRFGQR